MNTQQQPTTPEGATHPKAFKIDKQKQLQQREKYQKTRADALKAALWKMYNFYEDTSYEFDQEIANIEGEIGMCMELLGGTCLTSRGITIIENRLNWIENYIEETES